MRCTSKRKRWNGGMGLCVQYESASAAYEITIVPYEMKRVKIYILARPSAYIRMWL